ncbi:hypothetical protein I4U23_007911 [Adineta vaga]|nr:hypothetical protein I4U23_007911 [Adineta vaga]
MNSNSVVTRSEGFNVGDIVWARYDYDGMYWPGRITFISNAMTATNIQVQLLSYFVQFFGYNQTTWTIDVLAYSQYRDYMSKYLLIHYDLNPQLKYQFLNAINCADINNNSPSTSNSMIPTSHPITSYPTNDYLSTSYPSYASNSTYNSQISVHTSCSCCSPLSLLSTNQLSVDTNINPLYRSYNESHPLQDHAISCSKETFSKVNSVIIITTKNYNNPSFISFIFNSLSNIFHTTLLYIEHLSNYQHPSSTTLTYFVCFDHFQPSLQQTLDTTILNNLNAHVNYYFLLMNTPSQSFVKYFYSKIMDKRSIMVVHYHSPFESDPLLLCSGNRGTYEILRSTFLKYLCSKMKFIESHEDEEVHRSASNNIKQEPIMDMLDKASELKPITDSQDIPNESLRTSLVVKHERKSKERKLRKRKRKRRLSKHRRMSTASSDYYVHNILNNCDSA